MRHFEHNLLVFLTHQIVFFIFCLLYKAVQFGLQSLKNALPLAVKKRLYASRVNNLFFKAGQRKDHTLIDKIEQNSYNNNFVLLLPPGNKQ